MVNCCATKPPIENPRASEFLNAERVDEGRCLLRHFFNRIRTSPLELETPALLNKITARSWPNPSSPRDPSDPWFR